MIRTLGAAIVLFSVLTPRLHAQCVDWTAGFHEAGIFGNVNALATFDDGSGNGPELYLGGEFEAAGDIAVHNIVKWNGTRWAPVGGGRPYPVTALLVWNAGSGDVLVVACTSESQIPVGDPQGDVVQWNGTAWSGFAGTATLARASCLGVHDDGTGPALYVGGWFGDINGTLPNPQAIARFDGSQWSVLGTGLFVSTSVPLAFASVSRALLSYDDGSGSKLFVAGATLSDTTSGAQLPIWTWDGSTWTAASGGWNTNGEAHALCVTHASGGITTLYAGGDSTIASTQPKLMRWNGIGWDAVGPFLHGAINALREEGQPGSSTHLLAGGDVGMLSGLGEGGFGSWDGTQWTVPTHISENVLALASFDEGSGSKSFAGLRDGNTSNELPPRGIARLDASAWVPVGTNGAGDFGIPYDIEVVHHATGPVLYACGYVSAGTNGYLNRVGRLDGHAWSPVGADFAGTIYAIHGFDDGIHGEELYVCGRFAHVGVYGANRVARWDGSAWQPLGGGLGGVGYEPQARDMVTYDDGHGPRLIVVGDFNLQAGVLTHYIAAWDGSQWSQLGSGLNGPTSSAAVYDDGSGPALYVCGSFSQAGGVAASGLARWNGTTWSAVGGGTGISNRGLAVYDDGHGPKLYVTGSGGFGQMKRWDGVSWQSISGGPSTVFSMTTYDDGTGGGAKLYAAGRYEYESLMCFDGTTWTTLATLGGTAYAMSVFDDGRGPALFACGPFSRAGNFGSANIARYGQTGACTPYTGTAYCSGDGSGTNCPCGNAGAPQHGCANSANASGATLVAEGQAHLSFDTVTLRASSMTPNPTLLFFQGTGQAAGGSGATFGDGLRCVNGAVVRMAMRHASAGAASFGHAIAGDPSVSVAGHLGSMWTTRNYQAWYRDVQSFCTNSPFNFTNAVSIHWMP